MIEIKNLRTSKPRYGCIWQVRVDRTSVLGNPFYMHAESERDLVCDKYEVYFNKQVICNAKFLAELKHLSGIYKQYGKLELFCWCYPKRCHAETIRAWLLNNIK